jgi:hypothetical protein
MTANHPVQFHVDMPDQMARIHVLIRIVLLMALAAAGCSSVYWLLYLALPAFAALLIAERGGEHYLTHDASRIVRVMQWLAGAYAYLWLLTDTAPGNGREAARLEVNPSGQPTAASALVRLLGSLPGLIVLTVLSLAACFFWAIGAVAILAVRRLPRFVADFLCTTLRYQFRLIAYHMSLVDSYPSFEEAHLTHASSSGAA